MGGSTSKTTTKREEKSAPPLSQDALTTLKSAVDAYIYGYPLVYFYNIRLNSTSVTVRDGQGHAPLNQLGTNGYFAPGLSAIPAPSSDTIYTSVQLDLRATPQILSVPLGIERFFNVECISPFTDVVAYLGKRCDDSNPCGLSQVECVPNSAQGGDFLFVGPDYTERIPGKYEGRTVRFQYNDIWLGIRVLVLSTTSPPLPTEIASAQEIQLQFALNPLKTTSENKTHTLTSTDLINPFNSPPITPESIAFFDLMGIYLTQTPPPSPQDDAIVAEMKTVGVGAGLFPSSNPDLPRSTKIALQQSIGLSLALINLQILKFIAKALKTNRGWIVLPPFTGNWGTEYLTRATVAYTGVGANIPTEAIYPTAFVDSFGGLLMGGSRYEVIFKTAPPVCYFWSLTLYNSSFFLVAPPYSVGDRSSLTTNEDGSFTILVQDVSPNNGSNNWIRSPLSGAFQLTFRFYGPKEALLNNTWEYPIIREVQRLNPTVSKPRLSAENRFVVRKNDALLLTKLGFV